MEKPDFLKLEEEKFGSMADNSTWSDGCEHVWNTHVVPLQQELKVMTQNKEWADDAYVTLQKENKELKAWKEGALSILELKNQI